MDNMPLLLLDEMENTLTLTVESPKIYILLFFLLILLNVIAEIRDYFTDIIPNQLVTKQFMFYADVDLISPYQSPAEEASCLHIYENNRYCF